MTQSTQTQCRFCLNFVERKHSYGLFTKRALSSDLPSRLSILLDVPVEQKDFMPSSICRSCKCKMEDLEGKLAAIRKKVDDSYREMQANGQENPPRPLKRTQATTEGGSVDVSPSTVRAQPKHKRIRGRELFQHGEGD